MTEYRRRKPEKRMDYIYGMHSVLEAIEQGKEFDKVLLKSSLGKEKNRELLNILREKEIPFQFVPNEKLQRISSGNHQGVIGLVSPIEYSKLENIIPGIFEKGETPFLMVLDGITDVRNLGAIARTAEFAGIHAIVLPAKGSAQVNADAIKTSSGALHKIPVCRTQNLAKTIDFIKESGISVVAATEKAGDSLYDTAMEGPLAIVMGSEEDGISQAVLKKADRLVAIPRIGTVGSLNVSVAAGVLCFEAIRQRLAVAEE